MQIQEVTRYMVNTTVFETLEEANIALMNHERIEHIQKLISSFDVQLDNREQFECGTECDAYRRTTRGLAEYLSDYLKFN